MDISDKALEKAIDCFAKNQSKLARAIGVDRRYINFLRNRSKSISLDVAILIEDATNGEVSCFDLTSKKLLKKIMKKLSYPKLTISLAACLFLEQKETLKKRRGRPKKGDPFPHLKGRSRDLAADQLKLYSGRTL